MKHKGSISQAYLKRDAEILPMLMRQARNVVPWPTTMHRLCQVAASLPTPYFCIADDAALAYIRKRHLHGQTKNFHSTYRQKLYEALWQEFINIYNSDPQQGLPKCVWRALARPAPCVGMAPSIIQLKIASLKTKRSSKLYT